MYGHGANGWPGFVGGGYGSIPVGPTYFTGTIPYGGPAFGGVGLTHAGPGAFAPGMLGGSPFFTPYATPYAWPGVNSFGPGYARPYGLAHAGPEIPGYGWSSPLTGSFSPWNPAFGPQGIPTGQLPPGFVGLPLTPSWTGNGIG